MKKIIMQQIKRKRNQEKRKTREEKIKIIILI
jgi:hypothetical protein